MRLSDRLLAIANYILPGERVADIGTDHGLLPIFLHQKKIASKLILSDLKEGPLKKAQRNLAVHLPDYIPDLRLGNGLETLEPAEADTVIIAGMGGGAITEIMSMNSSKTRSYKKFILQPRSLQEELRIWLYNNGYSIVSEKLVREGRYICEIIVVDTAISSEMEERMRIFPEKLLNLEFEISPLLFKTNDPLLKEMIECRIKTEEGIIASIYNRGSDKNLQSLPKRIDRICRLKKLYVRTCR